MNESQQEIQKIVDSANRLLRDVIADLDRAVNTPTQSWTVSTRQRAMQALRAKAMSVAEVFDGWIQQNVQIKDIAKICGCLDSVAGNASFAGGYGASRTSGRAHLRRNLGRLTEVFGSGCEIRPEEPLQSARSMTVSPEPANARPSLADANGRPYSINDLAALHNLSRQTVIRIYENEPGVQVFQGSAEHQRKVGRRYRTIRVPRHVYLRVKRRMENR